MTVSPERYNNIAIILHWVMALAFFMMLGSGIVMEYADIDNSLKFQLYQWHKSGGVLLLLAFFLRIVWRLISHAPKLPETFQSWEKFAAKAGHIGLYALMLLLPLSGWVMVSSSVYGLPTIVFDIFEWPHIPGLEGNEEVENMAKFAHFIFAIAFGLLILGHIGAVIKHAVIDKENILKRMWFDFKKEKL